ncbi:MULTISPECIES: TrmB family transcriptional regulator [Halobacterium]|uniref:TrmB family transcriptional regulator n=1 Tax=Halobacterium TaxID=2239 RepID=UPI0009EA73B3|nr:MULTISPECIES: helix-turn-helix domain-containing protein [Halobacterium]MCG1004922.1 TrmB family transcriptional regulator [Halobacterium noricense]
MTEEEIITALRELGLSKYAAETLLGLQKVSSATASDIATITDVPRSQVYGATEELEQSGLVAVQDTNPKEFSAARPELIGDILRTQFEEQQQRVVSRLQSLDVSSEQTNPEDHIWRTRDTAAISTRAIELVQELAGPVVYFNSSPSSVSAELYATLEDQAASGQSVQLYGPPHTASQFPPSLPANSTELPDCFSTRCTQILIVGYRAVLFVVASGQSTPAETAFVTAETDSSAVLAAAFRSLLL